ncbi:FAD-binding oxidoreductase [Oleiagrimonas sp. C23AA]|uniref:NAD(P)/FAD-dependent oxidoreductase n=1 Tax=Oleiagrimonas sp. C23AA TaxID=2719047 RepID=UPI0014220682|nr:FAD-binding oxidoreductase [Oleiagrimonas sp. C23AA]NII10445.1 FAD-binding oxidoreductase [Oleiagrimonas sp. C23AA]
MHTRAADSYYRVSAREPALGEPLRDRRRVRVAVVGGGFAGLNTALSLAEKGERDVCVLEAGEIGFGASGRNGGFVFAGYSLGEQALLAQRGEQAARRLYGWTCEAVERIRQRVRDERIDCQLTEAGVIWANWFRDPVVLRQRQALLQRHYDVHWQWLDRAAMRERLCTERYSEGLFEPRGMHLHPLDYARGLARVAMAKGVALHPHSPVTALRRHGGDWQLDTAEGQVQAEHVVLACGGYLAGLCARIDRAILPVATYVMVTEPLGVQLADHLRTAAAVYDTRFAFDYYRPLADTRLLWGGRISMRDRAPARVRQLLRRDLARVYPALANVRVDFAWSGLMSYARHQMPQIGGRDGLWWAQGFGGHGLAPTTVAGTLLASAIADGDKAWHAFDAYPLVRAWRPLGDIAAQLTYSFAQWQDAWRDVREG